MQITVEIPDAIAAHIGNTEQDLSRAALEAIGLEAYRRGRLSGYELRTLLGISSRFELDAFLKERKIATYTAEDFEDDLAAIRESEARRRAERSA